MDSTEVVTETTLQIHTEDKSYRTLWGRTSQPIKWYIVIMVFLHHVAALVAVLTVPYSEKLKTIAWVCALHFMGQIGVTAGVHRLWCHSSYKANLPLKIILAISYRFTGQMSIYNWVRNHKVHHKYVDSDGDPHNIHRGFFYSHLGWTMMKKNPLVLAKGKEIDLSYLLEDPVVAFDKKYFRLMTLMWFFIFPIGVPYYFWNETLYWSIMQNAVRFVTVLHVSLTINSFAHMWGTRPFDKNQRAVQNMLIAVLCHGEGWHNYHHAFPWDYKVGEFGPYAANLGTMFIDFFSKIGWAYDLRWVSDEAVEKQAAKKGDGTFNKFVKYNVQ